MKRTTKPVKKTKKKPIDTKVYTLKELQDKLLPKQKRFCHRYIEDYQAYKSYMFAYGLEGKEKMMHAAANASKLLNDTKIIQYIAYIEQDILKEVGISKIGILKHVKNVAFADLTDLFSDWITRKELDVIKKSHPGLTSAIKKTDYKLVHKTDPLTGEPFYEEYLKVELKDSLRAAEILLKALGLNDPEKVELSFEQPLFPDNN